MANYQHCKECGGTMFPIRAGSDVYECEVCGHKEEYQTA